jgi:NAD(P)-dependent dehydrogenase (short-subunit alcohol dehydrogenase family)
VVEEITQAGGKAIADEHAVQDEADSRAMIDSVFDRFGRLDILICNAGIADNTPFQEIPLDRVREIMDVNFWGTLYPVHTALPRMLAAGYGRIVLTTSQAGLFGETGSVAYASSKAALIGMARSIARDVGEADIRVNLVAPAAYTPMSAKNLDAKWNEYMSPFKVAPVVGWLCSEACAGSGMIFNVGAGRVRRVRILESLPVEVPDGDLDKHWPELNEMKDAIEAKSSFGSGMVLMPELFAAEPDMADKR